MFRSRSLLIPVLLIATGCSDESQSSGPEQIVRSAEDEVGTASTPDVTVTSDQEPISDVKPAMPTDQTELKPLTLSALSSGRDDVASDSDARLTGEERVAAIMSKLKPLQVLLGTWRGTTRMEYEGMKAVDGHEWLWDLQTNPEEPALKMTSDKSPYARTARLTWNPDDRMFLLTVTGPDGSERRFSGDFSDPVHEIVGPDDKLHRVFRLQLSQTTQESERWQYSIVQQENNRYLLEIDKRRGTAEFRRYDVVSTQREGTSFALSDSDYGEKTCIISQGLGTIAVSFQGKSYWVCCTGCKAAFDEDPATWIARAEKRDAEGK